jgi:hypothetical protein
MHDTLTLLFCCILAFLAYYDFRYRALPVYMLVIALVFGILISVSKNGLSFTLYFSAVNTILISLQLGLTTLYFSIKTGKFVNIFNSYLGIGDLIFFLVVILCFSPVNFILFIISSGLITLLFYVPSREKVLIPLAGSQSVILCLILLFSLVFKIIQPYNDLFLMDIFCN